MLTNLNYYTALEQLFEGKRIARKHWQINNNQFLFLLRGEYLSCVISKYCGFEDTVTNQVWIRSKKGVLGPYSGSNCDIMAKDWLVL